MRANRQSDCSLLCRLAGKVAALLIAPQDATRDRGTARPQLFPTIILAALSC